MSTNVNHLPVLTPTTNSTTQASQVSHTFPNHENALTWIKHNVDTIRRYFILLEKFPELVFDEFVKELTNSMEILLKRCSQSSTALETFTSVKTESDISYRSISGQTLSKKPVTTERTIATRTNKAIKRLHPSAKSITNGHTICHRPVSRSALTNPLIRIYVCTDSCSGSSVPSVVSDIIDILLPYSHVTTSPTHAHDHESWRKNVEGSDAFLFFVTDASICDRCCVMQLDFARVSKKKVIFISRHGYTLPPQLCVILNEITTETGKHTSPTPNTVLPKYVTKLFRDALIYSPPVDDNFTTNLLNKLGISRPLVTTRILPKIEVKSPDTINDKTPDMNYLTPNIHSYRERSKSESDSSTDLLNATLSVSVLTDGCSRSDSGYSINMMSPSPLPAVTSASGSSLFADEPTLNDKAPDMNYLTPSIHTHRDRSKSESDSSANLLNATLSVSIDGCSRPDSGYSIDMISPSPLPTVTPELGSTIATDQSSLTRSKSIPHVISSTENIPATINTSRSFPSRLNTPTLTPTPTQIATPTPTGIEDASNRERLKMRTSSPIDTINDDNRQTVYLICSGNGSVKTVTWPPAVSEPRPTENLDLTFFDGTFSPIGF